MGGTLQVQIRQVSPSASEATVRGHRVLIDRPEAKRGADAGPMGGELFLASLGGCFMSNLLAAAKARGLGVGNFRINVTAELASTPDRFVAIDVAVSAPNVEREMLEKLVEIADRSCIMMNTLRGKLEITIRISAADGTAT